MQRFIQQHAKRIRGVLSGFDRLRFRGTIRLLAHTQGMLKFLSHIHVFLKNFKAYAQGITERVRTATERLAKDHGPALDLPRQPESLQGRNRSQDRPAGRHSRGPDLRHQCRRVVLLLRDPRRRCPASPGTPRTSPEMPALLLLSSASAVRLHASAVADLVPAEHPYCAERPRMAGPSTRRRRYRLSPSRQLLSRCPRPPTGSGTLGSAVEDPLESRLSRHLAGIPSHPSGNLSRQSPELLLVDGAKRVGHRCDVPFAAGLGGPLSTPACGTVPTTSPVPR